MCTSNTLDHLENDAYLALDGDDQGELAHRLLLLFSSVRAKNGTQWGH